MIAARAFPQQAFRSCLGLLRMGDRFTQARLEAACAIAFAAGATRYQHVESILKKSLDQLPKASQETEPYVSPHKNIRGSTYYQNVTGDINVK